MQPTAKKAIQAYDEAAAAIDSEIALQKERDMSNSPFLGRLARERRPLLEAMGRFLKERDPERTGMEIIRVSQSLRRFQEGTYTSFMSSPKWIRERYYLSGVAAMVIVAGESLGKGLPDRTT